MPRWMAILVGVVLVSGLPTAALPSVGVTPGRSEVYDAVVSKAVESDMFRMVVLAGLEGSGHHYLVGTAHAMFEANPDLPQVDMDDFPDQDIRSQNPYFLRYFMRGNASLYVSAEDQAREDMSNLAAQAAGLVSPGTIYVHHTRSFPALSGPNKALQYVDLPRMAEMAEVSGVDMRVLYLRRSAREMIIANTVHRYFHKHLGGRRGTSAEEENFMHYIWIMFTDMAVLQSMLGEIDPGFIVCHEWDLLGDEEQASRIAASIAPNDEIAGLIQYSLVHSAMRSADPVVADGDQGSPPSTREDLPFDGAEKLAARLQKKLDSFETRYCGPRRPSGRERW